MDWSVAKIGTIYQKPAHAIGLSAPPTPPIGCVLDLPGLPGAGNKIYDRSPYGNIGTITGAVWRRLPSGLWVLDFDGSDDYVDLGNDASLLFVAGSTEYPYTLEIWVYQPDGTDFYCFQKGSWTVDFEYGLVWDVDQFRVYQQDVSATAHIGRKCTTTLGYTTWNHLVGTYDGSKLSSGFKVYYNGSRVDNDDVEAATYVAMENKGASVYIGRHADSYTSGKAALPRIYNRVLSALEIQNHYQQEKHLFGVV